MGNRYSRLFSLVKIAFAPICACKKNRRIWCHNASFSLSRDVTYWTVMTSQCQVKKTSWLKWRNEPSMIVLAGLCSRSGHRIACKELINAWFNVNTNFILFYFIWFWVTREAIWQWFSLEKIIAEWPSSRQKIGIHSSPSINLYIRRGMKFSNFNGCTVEVWELINNFIAHITGHVILISAAIKVNPC